jgi:thiol-disulfide isomerase/thioredoxin
MTDEEGPVDGTRPPEPPRPTGPPGPPGRTSRPFIGPFSLRQIGALVATLVVSALLLLAINTPLAGAPDPSAPQPGSSFVPVGPATEGLKVGDLAPELEGTVNGEMTPLVDLDGRPIRLADLRGRPVWINFWATWCPPCQEETPVLRDTYEKYRDDGLALIAVSVQETTPEDVRQYVETYGLDYTVGFDATSAVFHAYRAFGLPTQLFIDREGVIREVVLGPVSREQADSIIEPLLAE